MKKYLLSVMAMIVSVVGGFAQTDTLSIRYSSPHYDNPFLKNFSELMEVSQLRVTLSGKPFEGRKFFSIGCHRVVNGVDSIVDRTPSVAGVRGDSLTIMFGARPIDSDSVYVVINGPFWVKGGRRVSTANHVLMQTYPEAGVSVADTIPVIAYTTGILHKVKHGDAVYDAVDYCGLRDSRTHPREWYAKYGIEDFIYYDVVIDE